MRRRAAVVMLALAAAFAAAPAALADNDTAQQGYGGEPVVQVPLEESAQESAEESAEEAAAEESAEEQAASPEEALRPPVAKSAGTTVATSTRQPVTTQAEAAATLPFTGAELAFVFVAGALLVLVGFGMHRLARPGRTLR
jgi:hypothetical protein